LTSVFENAHIGRGNVLGSSLVGAGGRSRAPRHGDDGDACGPSSLLAVICTRCRCALLRAASIGTGEAEIIAERLRGKHPGVLQSAQPMLGELLREVIVDEL